jgi:DNA replication and repair protein RecF
MDRLFAEPSSTRRKFIDRIVYGYDTAHAARVNRYDLALRERQKLLEENTHPAWLDGIETILAETGIAIAVARSRMAQRLDAACAGEAGPFPRPRLAMQGELENWLADAPALMAEDRFRQALADNRARDRGAGRCLTGAHRSDLAATYRDLPAALGSTGEQKGLVIAIILANAALMAVEAVGKPILLLDEITAHLDATRRQALFERLQALDLQAWMTGTETSVFDGIGPAHYLTVEGGQVAAD